MTNKTDSSQRMLNWLDNEKKRDNLEEKSYKNKILKEIKGLNKNELFPVPKKTTLWQKIKIVILGN
jgi:hypothetical protein